MVSELLGVAGDVLSALGVAAGGAAVVTAGAGSVGGAPGDPSTATPASTETLTAARTTSPNVMTDLFM
ncbi:hypothetical protein [Haloarcula amylolytica]|uniref:hypothetical protein n=1 Tax=Haloarcula amylolytica TaxID=396317 RepID=UPI003C74B622